MTKSQVIFTLYLFSNLLFIAGSLVGILWRDAK